jgi:hypothetical protein
VAQNINPRSTRDSKSKQRAGHIIQELTFCARKICELKRFFRSAGFGAGKTSCSDLIKIVQLFDNIAKSWQTGQNRTGKARIHSALACDITIA